MRLCVRAGRAFDRGFFRFANVTAIAATPPDFAVFFKNGAVFDISEKPAIAFFVLLFGDGNIAENFGDFRKAFLVGGFRERRIIDGPFAVFAVGGGFQIFRRGADNARRERSGDFNATAFEKFEKAFGVFFFLIRGFFENIGNLDEAVFFRLAREIVVAHARLRFSCKRMEQVLFGLGAF